MMIVLQDFDLALATLTHGCGVVVENGHVQIKKSTNKYTTFFSKMFEPFLLGYWVCFTNSLISSFVRFIKEKDL